MNALFAPAIMSRLMEDTSSDGFALLRRLAEHNPSEFCKVPGLVAKVIATINHNDYRDSQALGILATIAGQGCNEEITAAMLALLETRLHDSACQVLERMPLDMRISSLNAVMKRETEYALRVVHSVVVDPLLPCTRTTVRASVFMLGRSADYIPFVARLARKDVGMVRGAWRIVPILARHVADGSEEALEVLHNVAI